MTGPWQRATRAVRRALRRMPIRFYYHPRYELRLGRAIYDPLRGERILTFLLHEGLISQRDHRRPRPASLRAMLRIHTDEYLESLHDPTVLQAIVGHPVTADQSVQTLEAYRLVAGGTIAATRWGHAHHGVGVNLGGGLHHAASDRGRAFCAINDVAIATAWARANGMSGRVLVIDLDLHDGDGTRALFAADESVHTLSIHNGDWDDVPAIASTSVSLGSDVTDKTYLEAVRGLLPPLLDELDPQLVFYLAGCDPAATDELGDWQISPGGMLERDLFVFDTVRPRGSSRPLVILLAGGYGQESWRYSARFLASLCAGRRAIEPPTTGQITMIEFRRLATSLTDQELQRESADVDDWGLTEADLYGQLDGAPRKTRLLGQISKLGFELALEKLGLLERIREQGFPHPAVEFDLDNPSGETVYIHGDASRSELIAELRMRRDTTTAQGFDFLRIEWLLLQNPRGAFSDGRPRLPGQSHPGLGMLYDVIGFLVLLCERFDLDGLLFVPSHYHLAAQGERVLAFLEPRHAGWFDAVRDALSDLPLAEATAAVETGMLHDASNGESVAWQPHTMVLPVSKRLRQRLKGDEYRELQQKTRDALRFSLAPGTAGIHPAQP